MISALRSERDWGGFARCASRGGRERPFRVVGVMEKPSWASWSVLGLRSRPAAAVGEPVEDPGNDKDGRKDDENPILEGHARA